MKAKTREVENNLVTAEVDLTRMRQLRDKYRENVKTLEEQNKALRLEMAKATKVQPQGLYDSDEEDNPLEVGGLTQGGASLTKVHDDIAPGHNKNYPDAPVEMMGEADVATTPVLGEAEVEDVEDPLAPQGRASHGRHTSSYRDRRRSFVLSA